MNTASTLADFQAELAGHLRAPRLRPRPHGLPQRPTRLYAELVGRNIGQLVAPCFPVSRAVLGARWDTLVRTFVREGRPQTPLFRDVPAAFVDWLLQGPAAARRLPPWLPALAHYEWAELAVDTHPADVPAPWSTHPSPGGPTHADLATGRPHTNPTALCLHYPWAVHRIGPEHRPRRPEPTWLLVYRDHRHAVRFEHLNAWSAQLFLELSEGRLSGDAACREVAADMGHADDPSWIQAGLDQLSPWRAQDILIGVHDEPHP
jgi:hypothetical protein